MRGVKGQGTINKKEWTGVEDVLKQDRATDRADARQCVRELVPVFFKAYGVRSELQNVMQHEIFIQDKFEKSDPALRAVAFRDAFRAVHLFRVDLTASKKTDNSYLLYEGEHETRIASPIEYYDIGSGHFSEYKENNNGLVGSISGDIITFKKGECSGNLTNVKGTWNFEGSVSCGGALWDGEFKLR